MTDDLRPNYDEALVLDAVDRFLEREVRPHVHALEASDTWPAEIVEKMRELGLFGATIGEEYGGLGLPASTYAKIVERVSAVWMSVSGIFNSHLIMAAAVERFGSEAQKARYLPRFASGELRGGHRAHRARLRHRSSGHPHHRPPRRGPLPGERHQDLDQQRDPGPHRRGAGQDRPQGGAAPPGHEPAADLEKGEGFRVGRKLEKLGYKGIDSGELVFDECEVPCESLVGEREGRGLQQILAGLELGRINVAARGVGIARACLEESIAYSQVRKTFGKPICEHQSIQIKLAEMATRLEASRLLTEQAARAYERGERCDLEAGMAKLFATETALFNSLEAMRLHGAYGYSKEFNIERYYRDAPLLAIGEGTNELQRLIIARQLIERHPA